ncbi:hypothetical protein ACIQF6_26350 [Kitasatospora sp. NPDC092948]|uniref:hypothetical protein n=1 Tax=Kitasatospora sp. NPDC092948 TaxID=3364088 RepID=UPI00382C69DC
MESLRAVANRQVVGWIRPEQLPMAAAELLVDGHDAPSLVELAGCSGRERSAELEQLWHRALDELGVQQSESESGSEEVERWALHDIAARLASGEIRSMPEVMAAANGLDGAEGEAELRFLRAVREGCCEGCVTEQATAGGSEPFAAWEAQVRAAAAALVAGRR